MKKSSSIAEKTEAVENNVRNIFKPKTVFKTILFKDVEGNYYANEISDLDGYTRHNVTKEVLKLEEMEIYKKYIVISHPCVIDRLIKDNLGNTILNAITKHEASFKKAKEGYVGIDVFETEYYHKGKATAIINSTEDDLNNLCINFGFNEQNECMQINILNSFKKYNSLYDALLCFYNCKNRTHTFINTDLSFNCGSSPIIKLNEVSVLMVNSEVGDLDLNSVSIYTNETSLNYVTITSVYKGKYNLVLRSDTCISDSTIRLDEKENVYGFTLWLNPAITIKCCEIGFKTDTKTRNRHFKFDQDINIDLLGTGRHNCGYIYIDQKDHPDDILLDSIILYDKEGGNKKYNIVNFRLPLEEEVESDKFEVANGYITYIDCFCGRYIPIGEAIRLYGKKSINGSILKKYIKLLNKIIRSEYGTKFRNQNNNLEGERNVCCHL